MDDTAVMATSSFLVTYLEACLGGLLLWLHDWRIAINVLKSTAVLCVKGMSYMQEPKPV
jgi:hypothetical protein